MRMYQLNKDTQCGKCITIFVDAELQKRYPLLYPDNNKIYGHFIELRSFNGKIWGENLLKKLMEASTNPSDYTKKFIGKFYELKPLSLESYRIISECFKKCEYQYNKKKGNVKRI